MHSAQHSGLPGAPGDQELARDHEPACDYVHHEALGRLAGDLRHLLSELAGSLYRREAPGILMFTGNTGKLAEEGRGLRSLRTDAGR